jgi:hypothetical protein
MRTYKLTLKDKIYLFFHESRIERFGYLIPKVEKHQYNWFNINGLRIPTDFNKYIYNYVDQLIFEYEIGE